MKNSENLGFFTRQVHAGDFNDPLGSATVPIYQTSTFKFKNADHGAACFAGEKKGYIYTRLGNPTIAALENAVANLEKGFAGIATSSGMAAITTVYLTFLGKGKHIVSHNALYGPARSVMETIFARFGVEYTYVDTTNIENVKSAIRPETAMIYTETPANPTMGISDLKKLADLAHEIGVPLVVDNTFCSPYLQRPIEFGADVVVHSMTKFLNGHADIVAGMIITANEKYHKLINPVMINMGCNIDPHQAYMVHRGLKTLGLRIERAQASAMKIAEYLQNHPKVAKVNYPGLKSHSQYELAQKQMYGPGTMMAFELKGGFDAGKKLIDNVQLILLAVSLGGIESLIQHPASMTHSKVSHEKKIEAGITDELVRLSVGIENVEDLIADLDQAFEKV
ncbi:MAG: aminotransferase class I/II-fold pyridoxal phosphate-dependent enzyme [Bacteroidales bacterium]|jgi:methionine-gamma-lyase|nr:aminotransferase class I/II-fold pyridoxal phosphate-dependent enzyme [Bacteroidota bacterium]HOF81309.1 aminotransferase class I/II-fold pyridoxal phosphate-dependent enzyme [Bacteroidales bacterium]HOR76548.1 aminotransferase class I/II-fold pyridoxal phosphate-dependent enzyme [Bacteroidales bacterium]